MARPSLVCRGVVPDSSHCRGKGGSPSCHPSTPETGALGAPLKAQSEERETVSRAPSGATIVARGVGRIGLIVLVAYGIFECSVRGLMGFLAGLAMPVIAMMCEAAYEFVVSIRRPS